jgi:hypothetical protein
MMLQFIQLGDIFISIKDIIYADFSDGNSVMLVLRALDKEAYGRRFVANEEMQFSAETPEYHALRKWLVENSLPLVPFPEKVLEAEQEGKNE